MVVGPVRVSVKVPGLMGVPSAAVASVATTVITGKSLSIIERTAVFWVPNVAPPVGLVRVRLTVSVDS